MWVLVGFGYQAVMRAAVTGQGQPGHYLHFLAVAAGVALGLGLRTGWRHAGFRWAAAGLVAYAVLFGVAMSWAQVMLFGGCLFKAGTTNIYRLPDSLPPLLGLRDALHQLRTLAYPGAGSIAWVAGGLLILGGLKLAWTSASTLEGPRA